jgi:hypothetical protein
MQDNVGIPKKINPHTATKFSGQMVQDYLEHCRNGGSTPQFCREKRISTTTIDNWVKTYPDFAAAKKMAKEWAEGWWMDQAQKHLLTYRSKDEGSTHFDSKLYMFVVGGRFGHTSDKELRALLKEISAKVDSQKVAPSSAVAEEPDYELIDDNPTTE